MIPMQFYLEDDTTPLGEVKLARRVPCIGEGVTLEPLATGGRPRRFRVVEVDNGYVQSTPKSAVYKDGGVAVYLIDADDPRREKP